MNSLWVKNIIRLAVMALIQVILLKRVYFGWENFNYFSFIIYPLAILLLPIKTPKIALILIGFLLGISVDLFYDSPGVHASATVFLAFCRPYILKMLEPRGGFPTQETGPTRHRFGTNWFLTYCAIGLFLHFIIYFSMEVFTYVYFFEIILKTICSFVVSYICILLYVFLFNPKD